jgi:hypothetical protein
MEPARVLYERGEFVVEHRCTACGRTKRNRAGTGDDLSPLL